MLKNRSKCYLCKIVFDTAKNEPQKEPDTKLRLPTRTEQNIGFTGDWFRLLCLAAVCDPSGRTARGGRRPGGWRPGGVGSRHVEPSSWPRQHAAFCRPTGTEITYFISANEFFRKKHVAWNCSLFVFRKLTWKCVSHYFAGSRAQQNHILEILRFLVSLPRWALSNDRHRRCAISSKQTETEIHWR